MLLLLLNPKLRIFTERVTDRATAEKVREAGPPEMRRRA